MRQSNTFQSNNNNPNNNTADKKKTKKKCACLGRDIKVDPDLYFKVKEENEKLKKDKLAQDERIRKLEVSLANIKENIIRERKQADYKVINNNNDYKADLEKTKYENEKLKTENEKKNLIIQGLQSNALISKTKQKSKIRKKCKSKDPLTYHNEKNDYLALISRLREQLKIANEDRRTLISELRSRQVPGTNRNIYNMNMNNTGVQDPSLLNKVSDYENSQMRLDAKNKVLEITKNNLDKYIEKYEIERDNNRKLQAELSKLKGEAEKIPQYKILIEELKNQNKKLEEELDENRVNPFIKQVEERGNVIKNYQIIEKRLEETKKLLDEKERALKEDEVKLRELERENKQLKDDYSICEIQRDKSMEETLKLKIAQQEREKNDKIFQDKLNQFVQYGQIDANFAKMLTLLKLQNNDANWSNININYLEQNEEKANDPIYLKNKIEKLIIEKSELGKELETTRSLLITQQQINDDTKKLQECDNKKYQAELKLLKQKIEDLIKLIDVKKLPEEYLVQDPVTGKVSLKDRNELLNELIPAKQKDANLLDDNITEFSLDDTEAELSMNENALDIFFGECIYEDGLSEELGFSVEHMLSFFSVDFFVHETQTSDILNGKTPMFNFQLTFKVDINENLINYLDSENIYIDVYSLRDNIQTIFGKGKIRLKELIEIERSLQSATRVINSICSIYYIKNPNLKIANIHYKMRMRKPLGETLKWYNAQNKFIRQNNPLQDVVLTKAENTMRNYSYLGGKGYDVKILINKAEGLTVSGPGRKISPYFYYKFYKDGEKYSQISSGTDPIFEDVSTFKVIYNKELIDYIEKENLNVYLFDSMNPIELDINDKEQIRLINTNQEISKDLIGISRIPLKGLLINDLVQGDFPIVNMNNQKVGILRVNIFWEEINVGGNEIFREMPYETEAYKDELIVRLANALKSKGLNLDSAFNIFDMDKNNEITLENFKNILIFTLKFTTNQNEIEHLSKLLFTNQGRTKLTKMDFFKIFAMLLPHDGPASSVLMSSAYQLDNNDYFDNEYKTSPLGNNRIQSNLDSQFTIDAERQRKTNTQNMNYKYTLNNNIDNTNYLNNKGNETAAVVNTNRSLKELGKLVFEHRSKMGGDFSKLFKNLDKDGSLGIDKNELRNGYKKMGIVLSDTELNRLWGELSSDNKNIDFARFKTFHEKLFVPNAKKAIPIQRDQMNNLDNTQMSNTQMSGPFMSEMPK
jgi:protein fantom